MVTITEEIPNGKFHFFGVFQVGHQFFYYYLNPSPILCSKGLIVDQIVVKSNFDIKTKKRVNSHFKEILKYEMYDEIWFSALS